MESVNKHINNKLENYWIVTRRDNKHLKEYAKVKGYSKIFFIQHDVGNIINWYKNKTHNQLKIEYETIKNDNI